MDLFSSLDLFLLSLPECLIDGIRKEMEMSSTAAAAAVTTTTTTVSLTLSRAFIAICVSLLFPMMKVSTKLSSASRPLHWFDWGRGAFRQPDLLEYWNINKSKTDNAGQQQRLKAKNEESCEVNGVSWRWSRFIQVESNCNINGASITTPIKRLSCERWRYHGNRSVRLFTDSFGSGPQEGGSGRCLGILMNFIPFWYLIDRVGFVWFTPPPPGRIAPTRMTSQRIPSRIPSRPIHSITQSKMNHRWIKDGSKINQR